jgi:5-methylthioribose kinase
MINKNNLKKYLIEKKLISSKYEIEELSGGIINKIYRVKTDENSYVIKQFLKQAKTDKKLRIPSHNLRFFYEKSAINYLGKEMTPKIVFFDEKNKIICMEDLGEENRLDLLMLSNKLNTKIFSVIGKKIAEMHNRSFNNKVLQTIFNNESFHELSLEHRYYKKIDPKLLKERDELMRNCRRNNIVFIHHDLKMKNFFVIDNEFRLIDFEQSYYGDPAFDVGYFLGHLMIYYYNKASLRNRAMVLNFWNSYINNLKFKYKQKLEANVIKHAGFIIIYKLTGIAKKDFSFVKNKKRVIERAKKVILNDIDKVTQLF